MIPVSRLTLDVAGFPATKGSKVRNRYGALYEASKRLPAWDASVCAVALQVGQCLPDGEPAYVEIDFYLPRPKTAPDRVWPHVHSSGDVDKLTRAVLDALVNSGVLVDDSLVVQINAAKHYADDRKPGALIQVAVVAEAAMDSDSGGEMAA